MNKHRVFFALLPDEEIASHLAALGQHVAARSGSRLTPVHNLHLTLVFAGGVTSAQMDTLVACAHTVSAAFGASLEVENEHEGELDLRVRLNRLGFWPQGGVLWAGCRLLPSNQHRPVTDARLFADSPAMMSALSAGALPWMLAAQLKHALLAAGLPMTLSMAPQFFVPHVTLARGVRCASLPRLGSPLGWSVREFVLLESIPQGMHPRYETRAVFPLYPDN
ncbi:2'-5' RNA ligase family protein [Rugosibacter aromaticivorans]|uniref:2'-5' RNA ligase family protein n=1 Tax=Rugosibacter aromaticivorans TaxID=1565605 RepID=UPI00192A235E|nr:2'-5' RNA ligase family protein [Rugosibacter aromaticivorans]